MSKISELSDGGSLVSSDYLIAVRSGGNVKVRMDQINVDQIDLGDNEFIRLGNSQDLTIVHAATQSIINQAGIGDLLIQKAGSTKLTVNSSGIDVTGTVTADGVTSDGNISMSGAGTGARFLLLGSETGTYAGSLIMQAGGGSAAFGGSIIAYGHSHASKAGDIVAGISSGSGGSFRVNTSGVDTGGDVLVVETGGNVGIGVTPLSYAKLHISSAGTTSFYADGTKTSDGDIFDFVVRNGTDSVTSIKTLRTGADDAAALAFGTQAAGGSLTERMRIDSSGNLLVGTTDSTPYNNTTGGGFVVASSGLTSIARETTASNQAVLHLNNTGVDGILAEFAKDGTTVGSIGNDSANLYFTFNASTGIGLASSASPVCIFPAGATGAVKDNAIDLGYSSGRFDDIYATNGTIQTSDRNEKQDIEALSDAEQRVAVAAKGLLRKFRWKSSVAKNGDDARIHFGIIAQDLQAAFEAEGLDAGDYAMFIHSTWTDEETGEERSRMGVRYSELLAFIIAAI